MELENEILKKEIELPSELMVGNFCGGRIKEIKCLEEILSVPREGKLTSQQVPRHMRRRAVSHNPNRLPRRLRNNHLKDRAKSNTRQDGSSSSTKRPSRKYRRRPSNLLVEYNRRQRNSIWLETHIWHAKRFHITTKWGYKIPEYPNDKCFRASYRAADRKCLLIDMSYLKLFHLSSSTLLNLIDKLKELSPTFDTIKNGTREFIVKLYEPGKYPFGYIGEINCLWKNRSRNDLWIWCHPSYCLRVKQLFIDLFEMNEIKIQELDTSPPTNKKIKIENENMDMKPKKNVNLAKLESRKIPYQRTIKYRNFDNNILFVDLSNTVNRYRLIGPHSSHILMKTLHVSTIKTEKESENNWWNKFYNDEEKLREFTQQRDLWSHFQDNNSNIPKNSTIALTIRDPRILLPPKRDVLPFNKISEDNSSENQLSNEIDELINSSPLWDSEIRDKVSMTKCPDMEINKQRSELLVPTQKLKLKDIESRIPVLLINGSIKDECYNGSNSCKYYDIVSPAGWGMPLWLNFVFYGCRIGGLRENKYFNFEHESLSSLDDAPDSQVGKQNIDNEAEILKELYLRYPPDKRVNYNKLGIASPFSAPWKILIQDWILHKNPLLDKTKIRKLDQYFVLRDKQILENFSNFKDENKISIDRALIPIKLTLKGKGTISKNAIICIPSESDLEIYENGDFKEQLNFITEMVQPDVNQNARKESRVEHKKLKVTMRRKWKKMNNKLKLLKQQQNHKDSHDEKNSTSIHSLEAAIKSISQQRTENVDNYNNKINDLWIGYFDTIKDSCSRSILGFVVEGGFSLKNGECKGLGFVSALGLLSLSLESVHNIIVLVRETNSIQYRFANMSINFANI